VGVNVEGKSENDSLGGLVTGFLFFLPLGGFLFLVEIESAELLL